MINNINKKSFNIRDLTVNGAIEINSTKKRTRYTYDIKKMIDETKLEEK